MRLVSWTFLTNHGHVLVCLARDPYADVARLAEQLGVEAEEAAQVLDDLVTSGYVDLQREKGRVLRRVVNRNLALRHPIEAHHPVGRLLDAVQTTSETLQERVRSAD